MTWLLHHAAAVLLAATVALPDAVAGAVVFVDDDAAPGGDGATWATAHRFLRDALDDAIAGDEIRVAQGLYLPHQDEANPSGTFDRTDTFLLVTDVAVRGGYAGIGAPDPDLRDIDGLPTVLSGDLQLDDMPDFGHTLDNSFHVVTGTGVGPTAVLEGVTIRDGEATGAAEPMTCGGGLLLEQPGGSPTVLRCRFIDNRALEGGAVFAYQSMPLIRHCTFIGNVAIIRGGAIHSQTQGHPGIENCCFVGNSSLRGGAISSVTDLELVHCTVYANEATEPDASGGLDQRIAGLAQVSNCIFRSNVAPSDDVAAQQLQGGFGGMLHVEYTCIEGGADGFGAGNIGDDPLLVDETGPDGIPGSGDEDLHLGSGSPCIDAGDPFDLPNPGDVDIDGDARLIACRPDMGYDEAPLTGLDCDVNGISDTCDLADGGLDCNLNGRLDSCDLDDGLSIDCNGNAVPDECEIDSETDCNGNAIPDECDIADGPSNDGNGNGIPDECEGIKLVYHVPDDYPSIGEAVEAAVDFTEIIVADGTYTGPANREIDLGGRRITVRSENGPANCIINLQGLGRAFIAQSGETADTIVEGFTIRFGLVAEDGGGILVVDSDPTIRDCRFFVCEAYHGGGIALVDSDALVVGCRFDFNDAYQGAGLIADGGEPVIRECHFAFCAATNRGGGVMATFGSRPLIERSVFLSCSADRGGGVATLVAGTEVEVLDSLFSGNSADERGGGAHMGSDTVGRMTGCTFSRNGAGDSGGGVFHRNCCGQTYLTNCILWGNTDGDSVEQQFAQVGGFEEVLTINYCCVQGWTGSLGGTGNIPVDPRFVDDVGADGFAGTDDDDLHLLPASPCIDRGDPTARGDGAVDIDGDPRVRSCRVDMGADEAPYFDDCNGNGEPDACDLAAGTSSDCDADDTPDECQADCDGSGVPDGCEIPVAPFFDTSGPLAPINAESPQSWLVVAPMAAGDVTLRILLTANVAGDQRVDVLLNGAPVGVADGRFCAQPPTENLIVLPADIFNVLAGPDPIIEISLVPSPFVDPSPCGHSSVIVELSYIGFDPAIDCNGNGVYDGCDVAGDDCNGSGFPDECDVLAALSPDCNGNLHPDECDIATGFSADCNRNGVPDECDVPALDCNGNGLPDACDVDGGVSADCDGNGVPDECDVAALDCNGNGVPDPCDIGRSGSRDFNGNGVPDECDEDCNGNGIPDFLEIAFDLVDDCNGNGVPDECDVATIDCNGNGLPDDCDVAEDRAPDCNGNGVPDGCDVASGTSLDLDGDGVPDECERDCNGNGFADFLDILFAVSADCDDNGVPDECDVADGSSEDCNGNGVPDECDAASSDEDGDGIPDDCECPADVARPADGVVDVLDLVEVVLRWGQAGGAADVDLDGVVDVHDLVEVILAWGPCP